MNKIPFPIDPQGPLHAAPTVVVGNATTSSIQLTLTPVEGADGYEYRRWGEPPGPWLDWPMFWTALVLTGLDAGREYVVEVRAKKLTTEYRLDAPPHHEAVYGPVVSVRCSTRA